MPSKQTENYHLSQWEPEDQVLRTDFNEDNAKIDAELGKLAEAMPKKGNCRIVYGTYRGTGQPQTLTFDGTPLLVIVRYKGHSLDVMLVAPRDMVYSSTSLQQTPLAILTWGTNSVTISSSDLNKVNDYAYIALLAADE